MLVTDLALRFRNCKTNPRGEYMQALYSYGQGGSTKIQAIAQIHVM